MSLYRWALRPFLFRLDPETAHAAALEFLQLAGPVMRRLRPQFPGAPVTAFGITFPNVLGLAAGMDKNAIALDGWAALGFGHVEVGTVTLLPQPGNPKPRVFRIPESGAIINRLGFPSEGADVVAARLAAFRKRDGGRLKIGVNIGKNKDTPLDRAGEEYARLYEKLALHADYVAINVSSPNTPGLRSLAAPAQIRGLLAALRKARKATPRPFLVKLSPDGSAADFAASVRAALAGGADGLILTNTTVARPRAGGVWDETGGLSGPPLQSLALERISEAARLARGNAAIIGVGGISGAADADQMLQSGSKLVQLYTALAYKGPGLPRRIIVDLLKAHGQRS